jgi:hypothetical protein
MFYSFHSNSIFNAFYMLFSCNLLFVLFFGSISSLFHFILNSWPHFLHMFYYYFVHAIILHAYAISALSSLLTNSITQISYFPHVILVRSALHLGILYMACDCVVFYYNFKSITRLSNFTMLTIEGMLLLHKLALLM